MATTSKDSNKVILDPDFLRRLAHLKLETRMILSGVMKGEKRSRKYGTSVEFADYRDYHRGDDLRYLDWNIYARLERFFLKLFHEEEDLTVHILVDLSKSMEYGEPSKATYSKQLALALAYIGLINLDRISVTIFSDKIVKSTQLIRGRNQIPTVLELLNATDCGDKTDFESAMKSFTLRHSSRGLVFVVSDFLDPSKVKDGIKRIMHHKHDLLLLHVLDKTELEPDIRGDWALTDSENGDVLEVSVSPRLLADYKRRIVLYLEDLRAFSRKLGVGYVLTTTDIPIEDFILKELVLTGFVR